MATDKGGEMYSTGKLAAALGVSPGKVKKFLEAEGIQPDSVKGNCKYYGAAAMEKAKAALGGE